MKHDNNQQAAREWMPISSAPRDGTRFLAITESKIQRVDFYNEEGQGKWNERSQFWQEKPKDRYTHYMPLPPPPCSACDANGVFATDGSGPFDCYKCGNPAPPRPTQERPGD